MYTYLHISIIVFPHDEESRPKLQGHGHPRQADHPQRPQGASDVVEMLAVTSDRSWPRPTTSA